MQVEAWRSPRFVFGPASSDRAEDNPGEGRRHASPDAGLTLLIAEDEGLVAMNMENALVEAGFRVLGIVDTEADVIEAALRLKPDVIVMDITLREGNGITAARRIQDSLRVRIVFVSGNSDPSTLAAAREIRSSGFIRKPFLTDGFADLVRDAVRRGE
jgi:DNA-binding NarL/FixJ family response regulator